MDANILGKTCISFFTIETAAYTGFFLAPSWLPWTRHTTPQQTSTTNRCIFFFLMRKRGDSGYVSLSMRRGEKKESAMEQEKRYYLDPPVPEGFVPSALPDDVFRTITDMDHDGRVFWLAWRRNPCPSSPGHFAFFKRRQDSLQRASALKMLDELRLLMGKDPMKMTDDEQARLQKLLGIRAIIKSGLGEEEKHPDSPFRDSQSLAENEMAYYTAAAWPMKDEQGRWYTTQLKSRVVEPGLDSAQQLLSPFGYSCKVVTHEGERTIARSNDNGVTWEVSSYMEWVEVDPQQIGCAHEGGGGGGGCDECGGEASMRCNRCKEAVFCSGQCWAESNHKQVCK